VLDQGPGIPAEAQAQIFERFFRVDRARSRDGATETSGAGLGLAIARWIAEAHGGRLELVRSTDAGTHFQLVLPAMVDGDASSVPPPEDESDRDGLVPAPLTESDP
jgi:two-component system OmpR family sensor kinase